MTDYDVIVIGAGPAGSTVATLVAQRGHRVLLLERGRFPRFHIGESLMPETYWTFKRLGLLPKLRNSNFVRKYSVQFINHSGKESQPFYFDERNPHECSQTWQVLRSEFDRMMLENAAEQGVEVWQEANVTDILTEPAENDDLPRVTGVVVESKKENRTSRISARVVVDATGTNALISRRFDIRRPDPMLRKCAIFAHYKGAYRDSGKDEGATLVISTPDQDGWFWYIPLPDDIVSIGVVGEVDQLVTSRQSKEQTLDEEIARCAPVARRLEKAQRVSPVHVLSDFSYRSTRPAGEGWVLVGDAFGFLDPIYSSGVFLALKSGEMAADAINEALAGNDLSARQLGKWGEVLNDGMGAIRRLVYAFYTKGFSFGQFVRQHPMYKDNLVELLIGDVFRPEVNAIFTDMGRYVKIPQAIPLQSPGGPRRDVPVGV